MTTRRSRDQTIGNTQAAGRTPSTSGIARNRIAPFIARATGVADALHTVLAARDSGDPTAVAIAEKLLENKEFIASMIAAVEKIKADITAASTKPEPKAGDFKEEDPTSANHRRVRPGADSAAAHGSYSVADLNRDMAAQNHAAVMAAKNPNIGLDAASAQAASMPFLPAWDSNVWTADARQRLRDRAWSDGAAAAYLAKYGDGPGMRDQMAAGDTEAAVRRLEGGRAADVGTQPHPRSFDR